MNKFKFFIKAVKYVFGAGPDPYKEEKKVEEKEKPKPKKPKEPKPKKPKEPKPKKPKEKKKVEPVDPVDSLPGEIWRPTKYSNYRISNMGRLCNGRKGNICNIGSDGVTYTTIIKNQITVINIAYLVAETFLTKPEVPDGKQLIVTHINDDRADNRVENLRYVYEGMFDTDAPEVWRTVEMCTNYEVSNKGRVRHRKKHNILYISDSGYYYFGTGKLFARGDVIAAEAFISKPEVPDGDKLYVYHKDACYTNNCVDNLEWRILPMGRNKPYYRHRNMQPKKRVPKPNVQPEEPEEPKEPQRNIIQTRLNGEIVRTYIDIEEIISVHVEWYEEDIEESLKTGDQSYGYYWRYNE